MKPNLQKSINTTNLVIVMFLFITFLLSIYNIEFIFLIIPIAFCYLVLLLFDFIEYWLS